MNKSKFTILNENKVMIMNLEIEYWGFLKKFPGSCIKTGRVDSL